MYPKSLLLHQFLLVTADISIHLLHRFDLHWIHREAQECGNCIQIPKLTSCKQFSSMSIKLLIRHDIPTQHKYHLECQKVLKFNAWFIWKLLLQQHTPSVAFFTLFLFRYETDVLVCENLSGSKWEHKFN